MLGFNHALAGSIIAVLTPAPLVPVVAFASHYILDLTPHYGDRNDRKPASLRLILIDGCICLLALGFAMSLFPELWFMILVGAFFAALPDFFSIFLRGRLGRGFDRFLKWAGDIQWGERPYGWIFDVFYTIVMCITLYLLAEQPWS